MRVVAWAALSLASAVGVAQAAEPWGLENEKVVQLEGRVVDLACELARDCPADCGGGRRQLGVLTAEGRLLPLAKGNVNFANAVADLLPFCGRTLGIDGLLIESPVMSLLFVQNLRASPEAPWQPTAAFERDWKAAHGEAAEWYREDPAVKAAIAEKGVFGIPGLKPE